MITKYDMTSGEQIYQTRQSGKVAVAPAPYVLIGPTPSLQLVEVKSQPEPEIMPHDMATISISDFLRMV